MQLGIELLLVPCYSKSFLCERWSTHSWCKAQKCGEAGWFLRNVEQNGAHQSQPVIWHGIIFLLLEASFV